MNNNNTSSLRDALLKPLLEVLLLMAIIGLLCGSFAPTAKAQTLGSTGFGTRWQIIITNQVVVATTNTNSLNQAQFPIFKGRGLSFFDQYTSTNAATYGTNQYLIDLTPDGTNWTGTNGGLIVSLIQNGTNNAWTNILADRFDNMKYWRLDYIIPSTNSFTNSFWAAVDP